jgi:PAS domain S-box-containing protein
MKSPAQSRRLMRVLVVEDSVTQAQLHRVNLSRHGFEVEWVTSLAEVTKRLQTPGIDIVLLDLSLPDSEGIETFFRVHAAAEAIPIVVISAEDDEKVALQALKGGAQDYLIKGKAPGEAIVRCLYYAMERAQIESELRHSEKMTRLILENSYDAFWAIDSAGEIIGWNYMAEQTFGWKRSEVIGKTLAETLIVPRYLDQHLALMDEMLTTGTSRILNRRAEIIMVRKDGKEVPVELVVFKVELGGSRTFCAFAHDISERKAIQERTRQLNEELERRVQERTAELVRSNAELQQFAKIASHDLQEPLRSIEGYASLLVKRYKGKLDKDADEFLDYIQDGVNRMVQLIQGVLTHSRIGSTDLKPVESVDVNEIMGTVLANLAALIAENNAQVKYENLPIVVANKSEMLQLFQNLVGNAIKYRGERDPVIKISAEENVHEWVFSVEDNGIGIDEKYSEKIFDMFARLHGKTQYSGTGIGLAICKKIVETHGGRIWVQSEPGHGSIFLFTLHRFQLSD